MIRFRRFLLAPTLVCLAVFGTQPAAGSVGTKLGEQAFTYRETVHNDNLWTIAREVMPAGAKVTQNQVIAAVLRRNPEAFSKGNVFYLRKGVVLTIPGLEEVRGENVAQANVLFANQQQAWEEARRLPSGQESPAGISAGRPEGKSELGKKAAAGVAVAVATPSLKPVAPPVVSTPVPVTVSPPFSPPFSAAPALVPEPAAVTPPLTMPSASGTVVTPGPVSDRAAGTGNSTLLYGLGLMAILAGLYAYFRRRAPTVAAANPSAVSPACAAAATVSPGNGCALSMAGMETSHSLEEMAVTRQVVVDGRPNPIPVPAPATDDEAEIKLKMAKAYLELERKRSARALLEEVMQEGSDALRKEAGKLLGRENGELVKQ